MDVCFTDRCNFFIIVPHYLPQFFLLVLSSSLKFFMQCTQEFFLHFQRQTFCSAALTLTFIQDAFLSKAI